MNKKSLCKNHSLRMGLASSFVVLASALTSQAMAQDESQAQSDLLEEQVIVTGTKMNLKNAQDIKREADTVVDAISAEDIGALPDRSVLEAIQRLPGVSVERFQGPDDPDHFSVEGSGAVIRGMTQTRSEFNGRDSFSANSSRGLSFQDVPPELVGGVDVYKNQTADMIEGGIGGTISLRTRKPFDQDGMQAAINLDYSYGDLAEEWSPTTSGLFSNTWDTGAGEFGFLISAAYSRLYGESHGIQSDAYSLYNAQRDNGDIIPGAQRFVDAAGPDDNPQVWMPNSANLTMKRDDRLRTGGTVALQWRSPDDSVEITGEYIRSDSNLTWDENAIKYQGGYPVDANDWRSTALEGTEIEFNDGGMYQNGTLQFLPWIASGINDDIIPNNSTYAFGPKVQPDTRVQISDSLVQDMNFNVKWTPTEAFEIEFDYQHVEAEASQDDMQVMLGLFAGQTYDITGDTPQLTFTDPWYGYRDRNPDEFAEGYPGFSGDPEGDGNYFQDKSNYWWRAAMDHYERSEGQSDASRLDVTYHFDDLPFLRSVKGGVRYADREQIVRRTGYDWESIAPEWSGERAGFIDEGEYAAQQGQYIEAVDWSNFHRGNAFDIPGDYTYHPTVDAAKDSLGASPSLLFITNESGEWGPRGGPLYDSEYGLFEPGDISYTNETNTAAYIRIDFGGESELRYSGNIGLRYAKLERKTSGAVVFPDLIPQHGLPENSGLTLPLNSDSVITYLNQLVADGVYPDFASARENADGWINDANNYVATGDRDFGNNLEQSVSKDYTDDLFLPSFNIKVEMTDDLILRFAAARAAAYPDLSDVRNRVDIGLLNYTLAEERLDYPEGHELNDRDGMLDSARVQGWTGSGGNPTLEPMMSNQYDVALEWYFSDVGQLSGTIFHKNLSNYFIRGSNYNVVTNPSTGITRVVDVDATINGGNAKMDGFELSYQQFFEGMFDGFGVQATYTYIDASGVPNNQIEFEEEVERDELDNFNDTGIRVSLDSIPLQGQSDETVNLVGIYEKYGFNVRLAYNWRSKYLLTTRDVISKAPLWYDSRGQLDGSLFYDINDNFQIGLQGTNLTDSQSETLMQLDNDGLQAGRSWFIQDRRIAFIVKAKL